MSVNVSTDIELEVCLMIVTVRAVNQRVGQRNIALHIEIGIILDNMRAVKRLEADFASMRVDLDGIGVGANAAFAAIRYKGHIAGMLSAVGVIIAGIDVQAVRCRINVREMGILVQHGNDYFLCRRDNIKQVVYPRCADQELRGLHIIQAFHRTVRTCPNIANQIMRGIKNRKNIVEDAISVLTRTVGNGKERIVVIHGDTVCHHRLHDGVRSGVCYRFLIQMAVTSVVGICIMETVGIYLCMCRPAGLTVSGIEVRAVQVGGDMIGQLFLIDLLAAANHNGRSIVCCHARCAHFAGNDFV